MVDRTDPERPDKSFGLYRRRVRLRATPWRASADVEDDYHRFGVDVEHDGAVVLAIRGRALRTPWTTCPLAAQQLQVLAGAPLLASPFQVLRQTKLAQHCTHMVDMAALAIAAAARGERYRQYDASLTLEDRGGADWRTGVLEPSDGEPSRWLMRDGVVVEPAAYAGLEMRRAASWIAARSDTISAIEAAFVMQRAVLVAGGRRYELDEVVTPAAQLWMLGACFAFQPDRMAEGRRRLGSTRSFLRSEDLLADLDGPQTPS